MTIDFQIKYREGLARIGLFQTPNGIVNTPSFMPVLDPLNPNLISIDEINKMGAEIYITNAYLLYKDEKRRKIAINEGIHILFDIKKPIMTDSGAFQLMNYGQIDMTNAIITKFEEDINVDIGVFLDIPVGKGSYDQVKNSVIKTVQRADEHIKLRTTKNDMIWVGPIQGGKYLDLITYSSTEMTKRPFDIHAIGSVVPLLENYDYLTILKIILSVKKILPFNRPVHLFGAGHPLILSLAVYLGIDLFDSAAYILFAKAGRYLSVFGTYNIENLEYFPCSCKYCTSTAPQEIRNQDKISQVKFLALHNIASTFAEIRIIKQAIKEGRLWNLVLQRASAHPNLGNAVKYLTNKNEIEFLERFSSISYPKARFFSHPWSISDPLLLRYQDRLLNRYTTLRDNLILIPHGERGSDASGIQKIFIHPVLGLIPEEWIGIYPIIQHLSIDFNLNRIKEFVNLWLEKFQPQFRNVYRSGNKVNFLNILNLHKGNPNLDNKSISDEEKIASYIRYQYGVENPLDILPLKVKRSRKTNQIREFFKNSERWGGIRAYDHSIIPSKPLAQWLDNKLPSKNMKVIVDSDISEFIKKGKSVFNKFIKSMDPNLRVGDEALIVSTKNELLGSGKVLITLSELEHFQRGVGVKTRKGFS